MNLRVGVPTHTSVPQSFVDSVSSAKQLADSYQRVVQPTIVQLQAHSAKMQSLLEATTRRIELSPRLADQLQSVAVTVPQSFVDNISSAKQLADSYQRVVQPTLELSDRVHKTMSETHAIARRFDMITAPIIAQQRLFERSVANLTKPMHTAALRMPTSFPLPAVGFGGRPSLPYATLVRVASKAVTIVECALQRLRDRRRRDSDVRHRVELIINLPNGEFVQVSKLSATEDDLIRVIGIDDAGFSRERFLAPEVIQYELVTMNVPPPDTKLTVVKNH